MVCLRSCLDDAEAAAYAQVMPDEPDFDLTTYYLNQRRLTELVGADAVASALTGVGQAISSRAQGNMEMAAYKDLLLAWLHRNRNAVRPLDELVLLDRVCPGELFTAAMSFYCRGVRGGGRSSTSPIMHGKIATLGRTIELRLLLNRAHVAPGSPGDLLSGRVPEVLVVGVVDAVAREEVVAIPVFVGKAITRTNHDGLTLPSECEVHVDGIDSLVLCAREPVPTPDELRLLLAVPEARVKDAFAEIIGEPIVPKDWAGERSDLFTSYLRLDGKRVSAAFVFKGPSRPHAMSLADLGVRGDQIVRLMTEPVDLFALQHCHNIRAEVRHVLRTYAQHERRRCCMITGFDTLRILRAYGKCGFQPTAH